MRYLSYQIIFFLFTISIFAQSPHGDTFNIDCSDCHTADSWKVDLTKIDFDHSKTNFALIGQHINLDCKSCHESLVFSKMEKECVSCHKDIHQATVGLDCANCHTPATWIVKDIVGLHQKGRFPLLGAHKMADCAQCHSGYAELNFEPLTVNSNLDCYACHEQNYNSTQNPDHGLANFSTECQDCHNVSALSWNTTNIDHSFFPLIGGHALPSCFSCHQQGGNFSGLSQECYSCHQQTYEGTQNPNHIVAGMPTTCEVCHSIQSWAPAQFNHDLTAFPLTGKHIDTDCSNCHETGYTVTPTDCYACHQQDYQNANDPNHVASQFPTECSLCHSTSNWEEATFDHNQSNFPLTGSHIQAACASCHTSGYTGTPTDCYSCHTTDFNNSTNPNHVAGSYPTTCVDCHSTTAWQPATFDHQTTSFPLTGAHITTDCQSCHQTGYTGTPTDCYACHTTDYNNTTDPNHIAANFPTSCVDCHSTAAWEPATFDHDNQYFPIYSGSHNGKWNQCSECHTTANNYSLFSCIDCHEHNRTDTDQAHQGVQGYIYNSADCFACHPQGRSEGAFNHATSSFPLTGSHLTASCADCHQNGYSGTSSICSDCHITSYNNSVNPNHSAAGLSTECSTCHNANGWTPSTFDHSSTGFTLLGAHQPLQCSSCHNGTVTGLTGDCVPCHQTDYNSAANHTAQAYPLNCEMCHNSVNWNETTFDHQTTSFPLTGAHITTDCQSCHQTGYTGTPTDCYSCHTTDFNNTTNPNHVAGSYPTTCVDCHSTTAWQPATFDHNATQFPLTGAHISTTCQSCHSSGYTGTPTDCYACHATDFNNTTNPNHVAGSYPTTCVDCHSTTAWEPATIDHNFYPIGNNHNNVDCNECHSQPNYQPQCLSCHLDDFNDGHDTGDPTDCWGCHSTSNWDSNFDHSNTNFPLTGAHTGVSCQLCHANGYQGTSTECVTCHQTDYQQSINPNHTSLALSTACQTCHTTIAGWAPATFPDHNNFFQLIGAHSQINNCVDCHQGNYNSTANTCIGCHLNNFNGTTDPPHQTLNFSENCLTCHTMNGWTPATFNHNFFPIGNNHNIVDCNECHSQPNYQPQCLSCHLNDFNDGHDNGDPTDCWNCHSTSDWDTNLRFDHNNTYFPLSGAHINVECAQCHTSNQDRISTECVACHMQDYLKTANPNHQSTGISTDCISCHKTNNWNSTFKILQENREF